MLLVPYFDILSFVRLFTTQEPHLSAKLSSFSCRQSTVTIIQGVATPRFENFIGLRFNEVGGSRAIFKSAFLRGPLRLKLCSNRLLLKGTQSPKRAQKKKKIWKTTSSVVLKVTMKTKTGEDVTIEHGMIAELTTTLYNETISDFGDSVSSSGTPCKM